MIIIKFEPDPINPLSNLIEKVSKNQYFWP